MRSPITTERQNIQLLRESGFTQQQAEAVATVVENALQVGFDKFSEVLQRELSLLRSEIKIEIRDSRIEIQKSITEQIWKILAIVVGVATISLAVLKLAPNWPG